MSIVSPKRLRSGSKVAIVAPSGAIVSDEVNVGIDVIRECGLEPVLGPCVKNLRTRAHRAASVEERVEELNWAFSHPNVSAVVAAVGGEGSAALLPHLDFELIRNSRKAFVGMSDLTSINSGILTAAGLINFVAQSPSIRLDKGAKLTQSDCESFKHLLELLKSDQAWDERPFMHNPYFPRTVSPGVAEGIAVGGNLNTFVHLIGTEWLPPPEGSVFFIEDFRTGGEQLSRELLHLKLIGYLDAVEAIVIGEFEEKPKKTDPKMPPIDDVIVEYLQNGPPCTYGYDFSHGPYTAPIPIGAKVHVDADVGIVSFDFRMSS